MKAWFIDTIERVAFTFAETFIALMLAAGTDWLNLSAIRAAGIGALAAALAVIKAAIASRATNAISPASMAPATTAG